MTREEEIRARLDEHKLFQMAFFSDTGKELEDSAIEDIRYLLNENQRLQESVSQMEDRIYVLQASIDIHDSVVEGHANSIQSLAEENQQLQEMLSLADGALEAANAIYARQQLEPLAPGYNIAPPEYERMMKPIWAYREARKAMQGDIE